MVYLYAIAEPLDAPPPGPGLERAAVRLVDVGELVAVVSDCDGEDVVTSPDALWLHETVVEQLAGDAGGVLPMPFGTIVAHDSAVRRMLRDRRAELLAGLRLVRDAVEIAVHITWAPTLVTSDPTGSAHLVNRLERTRGALLFAERMDTELRELARAGTRHVETRPAPVLNCAYLVDREAVERFRERVEDLGAELAGASVVCTGPWPPYSFAVAREA